MATLIVSALLVACLAWLHHRTLSQTLARIDVERQAWTRERQVLLNRIDPTTSQYVDHTPQDPLPAPLPFDDDDAYWTLVEGRETREELAERLAAEEMGSNGG